MTKAVLLIDRLLKMRSHAEGLDPDISHRLMKNSLAYMAAPESRSDVCAASRT